ncbi:hypothetical protein CYLTODRAFT_227288 [Cylindrobasidium torrendii FP15055 ss-10]|uniref:Pali-domain-containing protein n=1 Tax=Cylindrobasidium torrendii FP15055 ss-10 TaxID=1314674 RepID=A0A0D7BIN1_9AGAR|nr:hypothetical protein CYLTODRAFT_227288 [Cylindrobasidium torrendii FP15055 ss-10]
MVKPQHLPFYAHRITSLLALTFLLAAFILLLLVGLSLPITKAVYIIRVYSTANNGQPDTSVATELRFGVWGLCALSKVDVTACYGPKLGYDIPTSITDILGIDGGLVAAVLNGLLAVLILHLVAAGFSLCALIPAMFLVSHAATIVSLVLSIISALLSAIMFSIDTAVVLLVKNQLSKLDEDIKLTAAFGDAVWMALAAMLATSLSVICLSARACYCCGVRRHPMSTPWKSKDLFSGLPSRSNKY